MDQKNLDITKQFPLSLGTLFNRGSTVCSFKVLNRQKAILIVFDIILSVTLWILQKLVVHGCVFIVIYLNEKIVKIL